MNAVCDTDPTTLIMALFEPLSSLSSSLSFSVWNKTICIILYYLSAISAGGGPRRRSETGSCIFARWIHVFFFFFFSLLRFFLPAKRIFIPSDARGKQSSFVILPLPLGKRLPANTVNLTSQTRAPRIRRRSRWTKRLINR